MIGINECSPNITSIEKQHFAFVSKRVGDTISFYIDVLEYIQEINGKRVNKNTVNTKIKSLKQTHHCGKYKSLLNLFLKSNKKIETEEDAHFIRLTSNRVNQAKNLSDVLPSLYILKKRYKFLLAINFNYNNDRYYAAYQKIKTETTQANFLLKVIFDYETWFNNLGVKELWGPYQLTSNIGLNCCPYCNRQYTFTVKTIGGKKIARPELDHFLPQTEHPLLALSFFNLIPSCTVCNSSVKGSVATSYNTHFSPYRLNPKHSLIQFSYFPKNYEASIGKSEELEIELKYNGDITDIELQTKIEGNIKLFCLKELYTNHRDIVREIILKREATSDQYIKMTQQTFKKLSLTEADVYRLAYGNYFSEKDFHKRPLSKLTKDIAYELGVLPIKNMV